MQNPLSLDSLISWLEKQPADGSYNYVDPHGCLIYQYLEQMGFQVRSIGGSSWLDPQLAQHDFPVEFNEIAARAPNTYGVALQRAKELRDGA